jgi:hypothetical protein
LAVQARYCDDVTAKFAEAGIDTDGLASRLQEEGVKSFVESWNEFMACIASKSDALKKRETRERTPEVVSMSHNANQKRMDRDEEDRDLIED